MPAEKYLSMSIPELIDALGSHAESGSMRSEEIKGALQVKMAEESARPTRRANIALALSGLSVATAIASVVVAAVNG